jgi:hypothetical protein
MNQNAITLYKRWAVIQPDLVPMQELYQIEELLGELDNPVFLDVGADLTALTLLNHSNRAASRVAVPKHRFTKIFVEELKAAGCPDGVVVPSPRHKHRRIMLTGLHATITRQQYDLIRLLRADRYPTHRLQAIVDLLVPLLSEGAIFVAHQCSDATATQLEDILTQHMSQLSLQRHGSLFIARTGATSSVLRADVSTARTAEPVEAPVETTSLPVSSPENVPTEEPLPADNTNVSPEPRAAEEAVPPSAPPELPPSAPPFKAPTAPPPGAEQDVSVDSAKLDPEQVDERY